MYIFNYLNTLVNYYCSKMANWNTYFLVKMLTLWNYLTVLGTTIKNKCQNIYYYLKDYFHGHHDMWLFVPGHTIPLSLSNLNNMVHINWLYDNFDNTLALSTDNKDGDWVHCNFSWLSAKIQVTAPEKPTEMIEYEIDDFIEKFTVYTKSDVSPSLYMVFMCWCAHSKHWFKMDDNIQFCIIDHMGEEFCFNINDNNNSICIKRNKLYIVVNTGREDTNTVVEPTDEETPLKENRDKKNE